MKVIVSLVCLILIVGNTLSQTYCPSAPAIREDRRVDKSRLIISTFNTEWLFLTRSNCPGTGCTWKDLEQARYHLNHIADKIAQVNADIFVLEEVENCAVLRELLSLPQLAFKGYKPYMVQGTDTATGQNVGIITRIDPSTNIARTTSRANWPIAGNTCKYTKSTEGNSGVSKHLYATFNVGLAKPLLIIGLHLLAFPTTAERCVEREAQATVIRSIIDQHPGYHVAVLGDFNDYDADLVDESLVSIPTSRVIPIIKGSELINTALSHPGAKTGLGVYSSWWDKNNNCKDDGKAEHTTIDHILLSKTLSFKSFAYAHIFNAGCTSNVSDHWPVVVEIETRGLVSINEEATAATAGAADDTDVTGLSQPAAGKEGEDGSSAVAYIVVFTMVGVLVVVFTLVGLIVVKRYRSNSSSAEERKPIIDLVSSV